MPQKAPHKLLNGMAHDDPSRDLAMAVDAGRVPAHIAIIMDGNGRWAKQRFLPRFAGHKTGVTRVHQVVEDCSKLGVKALTLYAFSAENWKRPRVEVDTLWRLLRIYLRRDLSTPCNGTTFASNRLAAWKCFPDPHSKTLGPWNGRRRETRA